VLTAGEHTLRLLPPLVVSSADVARGPRPARAGDRAGAPVEGLA
jgi:acetylornithine/succinyldiaminopimelate/putrescine aminotransferase